MIIWLSGPTGAGKTSLARLLVNAGYSVVREVIPAGLFEAFAADPWQHCAAVQKELMLSRKNQWDCLSDPRKVVFDRSIDEDILVFCQMHRKSGFLKDDEFEELSSLAAAIRVTMPAPDLIVYVYAEHDILRHRLKKEGHPKMILDGLSTQIDFYNHWVENRHEPVLRIDNSRCNLAVIENIFKRAL